VLLLDEKQMRPHLKAYLLDGQIMKGIFPAKREPPGTKPEGE
jgi:hypothetical protein